MNVVTDSAILTLVSHLVFMGIAFFSLQALDLEKMIRKNKVVQARLLYILLAVALGYGVSSFFLSYLLAAQNLPSF
ncbi:MULTISPECIES: DUF1146 family protein [Brochothrix]|uniref:DUF1146 domain-containing protein n=2 Tax=Brochothrix thermosphacta TaxID=2756 RepID=A0A2X0SG28_BROTH|nr:MULTISPECIES: DUF1146 family protein [Brochothrix]ANZ94969.1 hypothetical protein BFC19_06015 [Brochothrix thermosphacta]ANZ96728.1 hypothetical protein BFC20_02770 [Brochothrix thermosphacta]EUJ34225.1 hypothetical protein BTHER_13184 [Brochothrix thermosphacta DSM 20171 = FSL F6-1036]MDO7864740.1 DUF1146 family protein [Brochothrix thermosphacta]ODJ49307.1 hypothetical protein BFR34_06650 [Brochothrix thermosphacta DSM 20171 = FSL F6-1036]